MGRQDAAQKALVLDQVSVLCAGTGDALRPGICPIAALGCNEAPCARGAGDGDVAIGISEAREGFSRPVIAGYQCPHDYWTAGAVLMDIQRQSDCRVISDRKGS